VYFDEQVPGDEVRYVNGRLAARVFAALDARAEDVYARGYLGIYAALFQQERLSSQYGTRLGLAYLNGRSSPLQPASHLGLEQALADGAADRLLAAAGTRFAITSIEPRNPALEVPGLSEVARDDEFNLRLLAVRDPQPFARLATVVREVVAGDSYDTLAALQARAPGAALLETHDGDTSRFQAAPAGRMTGWRRPSPERIEIDVDGVAETSLLVVTESWATGWRAAVDGEAVDVRRADLRLLGVTVPAGAARVVLEYRTPRLLTGAAISATGLLLCALLLLSGRRRRA
jgi:hypothetical protein